MKKLLFALLCSFALLFSLSSTADAKTILAKKASDYTINTKIYKKAYVKSFGKYPLCGKNKSMLTFVGNKSMSNLDCYKSYSYYYLIVGNNLRFGIDGSDFVLAGFPFPLAKGKSRVQNYSYSESLEGKSHIYITATKLKKYKTKAGTFKNVLKIKQSNSYYYLAKNRGIIKQTTLKGKTIFEITKFVKK